MISLPSTRNQSPRIYCTVADKSGDGAITGSVVVHYLTWKEKYPAHIPVFEDERGDFPHLPNAGIM